MTNRNMSNMIEEYLKRALKEEGRVEIQRNEIAELFDKSDSLELLGTTLETFKKHANDDWNWHKWSFNHNFQNRFWAYISRGRIIRKIA